MIDLQASHWPRAFLVVFLYPLGVQGFVNGEKIRDVRDHAPPRYIQELILYIQWGTVISNVTNNFTPNIGLSVFVKYGVFGICQILGVQYLSNMGPYTVGDRDLARHESSLLYLSSNIDKSHPLMTNPYSPSGQGKLQAMLSANERPGN